MNLNFKPVGLGILLFSLSFSAFCESLTTKKSADLSAAAICRMNDINYDQAVIFVKDLKAAVKSNNADTISHLIAYPVRVNYLYARKQISKKNYILKDSKEFIQKYNEIFTPAFKQKLLNNLDKNIFCNAQGAMIDSGSIWFKTIENKLKILSINTGFVSH